MIFLYTILAHIFFVWIVLRLLVPYLGFIKKPIPGDIPAGLQTTINRYNQSAKSDREFLELSYEYVTHQYTGSRIKTVTQWWKAFTNVYTQSPGFLPCTGQNHLMRTMLIKSGRFNESDISIKVVPLNFFIHQYLIVTIDGSQIAVDPWSHFLGKGLGNVSSYFG